MKKIIIAIIAFLYLGASSGAAINIHYCMGRIVGWDIGHYKSKTCRKCGMEVSEKKDNGCCKNEHKFLKNNADQKITEAALLQTQLIAIALPATFIELASAYLPSITEENPIGHAPPRSNGVAVYICNCVFLI